VLQLMTEVCLSRRELEERSYLLFHAFYLIN